MMPRSPCGQRPASPSGRRRASLSPGRAEKLYNNDKLITISQRYDDYYYYYYYHYHY